MFMHNGEVAQFNKIKRRLQAFLDDRFFHLPLGSTDSEWCFSLFLQHLSKLADVDSPSFDYKTLHKATLQTIDSLNTWAEDAGITEPSLLNFVVTDGKSIVATRYISSVTDEAASLWFSTGTVGLDRPLSSRSALKSDMQSFEQYKEGGHYRMRKDDKRENIVVSSMDTVLLIVANWTTIRHCSSSLVNLSHSKRQTGWRFLVRLVWLSLLGEVPVERAHGQSIDSSLIFYRMNVLQIPIRDKYFQHSLYPHRDQEFAYSKGYQFSRPLTEDGTTKGLLR